MKRALLYLPSLLTAKKMGKRMRVKVVVVASLPVPQPALVLVSP